MINFDNITVYVGSKTFYNVYGSQDNPEDGIMLTEDNCFGSNMSSFDFATGFAAALLSAEVVNHTFITKVTCTYNVWGNDSEDKIDEEIIWQGSNSSLIKENQA